MTMKIVPLSGSIGAEIQGVNLAKLEDGAFAGIRQALLDHSVICFRDQNLTSDEQLAFAEQWGKFIYTPI